MDIKTCEKLISDFRNIDCDNDKHEYIKDVVFKYTPDQEKNMKMTYMIYITLFSTVVTQQSSYIDTSC